VTHAVQVVRRDLRDRAKLVLPNPKPSDLMKSYLIGYDLNKPGKDYADLFSAIKKIAGTWWHCLDSTWIIKSDSSAAAIRDALMPHIDKNDELLVVQLVGEGAWVGFDDQCSSWLKEQL
jgi:hypothetical protein